MKKKQIEKKAQEIAWQTSKHYDPIACKQEWCQMAAIDMACWLLSNQWVSVEDELPNQKNGDNESEYVFVKLTCGRLPWTACYSYENQCWMDVNHQAIHSVTHWMPIPPLKEEGGEKK